MGKSKFDVLIPVYHGDDPNIFFHVFQSIMQNTLQPNTIVVVFDGKVHEQIEHQLKRYKSQGVALCVERLEFNMGLATALNYGLRRCTSEFVVRCDADDLNMTDRFEQQITLLSSGELDIVSSAIYEVDPRSGRRSIKLLPTTHHEIKRYARLRNPFNHMAVAYRRQTVMDAGGYPDVRLKEDYALWLRLLAQGAVGANFSEPLVEARAGINMVRRRQGWASAQSEWELFLFRLSLNGASIWKDTPFALMRFCYHLMPVQILKVLYSWLRQEVSSGKQ